MVEVAVEIMVMDNGKVRTGVAIKVVALVGVVVPQVMEQAQVCISLSIF
jgi:hypothetical protein